MRSAPNELDYLVFCILSKRMVMILARRRAKLTCVNTVRVYESEQEREDWERNERGESERERERGDVEERQSVKKVDTTSVQFFWSDQSVCNEIVRRWKSRPC